ADRDIGIAVEQQLADDLLRPGRARFGIGRDDDVVVAKSEIVPHLGIEVVIVDFALLLRPGVAHRSVFPINPVTSLAQNRNMCAKSSPFRYARWLRRYLPWLP